MPSNSPPSALARQGDKVYYGGDELAVLVAGAGATPKTIDLQFPGTKKTYEVVTRSRTTR